VPAARLLLTFRNWAWHEYGNASGLAHIKVFDEFKISGVLAINGSAARGYPRSWEAAMASQLGVHGPRLHAAQHARGGE